MDVNFGFDFSRPCGIVDMGSNGIRFSISNLAPPTTRVMPALFQDRAAISLYDAQINPVTNERQPIQEEIIRRVVQSFLQFKRHCADFGVPEQNIKVLATEATRTATNSEQFRAELKASTGWDVTMLPKEMEGKIGAMGVASSFREVHGLVMDLGGGSTQLTWLVSKGGSVELSPGGSVSLPFGAAALLNLLKAAEKKGGHAKAELDEKIRSAIATAYKQVRGDGTSGSHPQGIELYLSGGGFRGWGNICMDINASRQIGSDEDGEEYDSDEMSVSKHHKKHGDKDADDDNGSSNSTEGARSYPIPIINGFSVSPKLFFNTKAVQARVNEAKDGIFRVSPRRASQVRAVAVLVSALHKALPAVSIVNFCQGGVREGALFYSLPVISRQAAPIDAASEPFAPVSSTDLFNILTRAIPTSPTASQTSASGFLAAPPSIIVSLLYAFTNLLYLHLPLHKENQSAAALRSTTSGALSGVHGVSHLERATLALMLCARWGNALPRADQDFQLQLQRLVGKQVSWWANYVGAVAALVGDVYPAGAVNSFVPRIALQATARLEVEHKKHSTKERPLVDLQIRFKDDAAAAAEHGAYDAAVKEIVKVGKKKHWVQLSGKGGRHGKKKDKRDEEKKDKDSGFGIKVKVAIVEPHIQSQSEAAVGKGQDVETDDDNDDDDDDERKDVDERDASAGSNSSDFDTLVSKHLA